MAKASLTLPDGTIVLIEGSVDEIERIISLHRPESVIPKHVEKKKTSTA